MVALIVIGVILWLISVVAIFWMSIGEAKEYKYHYTVGDVIRDLFLGSVGCGLVLILLWATEKFLKLLVTVLTVISKWLKPFLSKKIF